MNEGQFDLFEAAGEEPKHEADAQVEQSPEEIKQVAITHFKHQLRPNSSLPELDSISAHINKQYPGLDEETRKKIAEGVHGHLQTLLDTDDAQSQLMG